VHDPSPYDTIDGVTSPPVSGPPDGTLSPDGAWRWQNESWVPTDARRAEERTTSAVPTSKGSHGIAPRVSSSRGKWTLIAVGVLALALLIGGGVTLLSTGNADSVSVQGSLTITTGGNTKYDPCVGTSGYVFTPYDYTDLRAGTPVRILNSSGTIIGTGSLGDGHYSKGIGCRFDFDIPLDSSSADYQIVIGQRPPYDFTDPSRLHLSV
jgi:hypothetical protein